MTKHCKNLLGTQHGCPGKGKKEKKNRLFCAAMQNVNVPTVYDEKVPNCIQMNKRLKYTGPVFKQKRETQ